MHLNSPEMPVVSLCTLGFYLKLDCLHLIWIDWNDLTFGPVILSVLKFGNVPKANIKRKLFVTSSDTKLFCYVYLSHCRELPKLS